jgi:pectate lyase
LSFVQSEYIMKWQYDINRIFAKFILSGGVIMTGKKLLIVSLLVCYIMVSCIGTAMAMPKGTKIMVIEDFDEYFKTDEVISERFGGKITSQEDIEPIYELSQEHYYNGGQSFGVGGIYHENPEKLGGMVFPYMSVPASKTEWTNAEYIQFWIKNTADIRAGVRLELIDGGGTAHSLPTDKFECEMEKRSGEAVFLPLKDNSSRRVYVPAGYEGIVRVPLSLYSTLTNLSMIKTIRLGMSTVGEGISGKMIYFDYFHIVTADYVNPNPKVYPPELKDSFLRINEQTMQLCFTSLVDTTNATDTVVLTAYDDKGKSLGAQSFETGEGSYLKAYYQLPEDLAAGTYKITATVKGNADLKEEFVFPIYRMEPTTYADVWNTEYEQPVELLAKMGIVSGYEDNTFKPDKTITRAEFAALMVRMLALTDKAKSISEAPFDDTAGHWSAGNIAAGVEAGIINGYGDGNFGPDDTVTYEQAVKMIVASLGYGQKAEEAGGYPAGYKTVGDSIGVSKKVVGETPQANRGNIAIMLRNALIIEIQENGEGARISLLNKNFEEKMDELRYSAAITYGDNILKYDKDVYGYEETPLFVDGINIFTMQPAVYVYDGVKSVLTNFTSQQNTLRTLEALTNMTGNSKYVDRAKEVIKYNLENICDQNGNLYAGGHMWWDSFHETTSNSKTRSLELKSFYPYYDLWYQTDKELASRAVAAIWDSKMTDWSMLTFSRHGSYNKAPTARWDSEFQDPDPWYKVQRGELPFYMTGIDLVIAALKEGQHAGNDKAKVWAKRLLGIYEKAADPVTHLIPDIYILSGAASISDRGLDQLGEDYKNATEGNIQGTYHTTAGSVPDIISLYDEGLLDKEMFNWIVEDSLGYLKYQYDAENHQNKYILADGTDLAGYTTKKDGYFGNTGTVFKPADVGRDLVFNNVALYMRTGKQEFWDFARDVAEYYDLGDIGASPGKDVNVNLATTSLTMGNIFAMCDLYEATGCEDYLKLAKAIANNSMVLAKRGFFMTLYEKAYMLDWPWNKVYVNFNDKDAWAILRVEATMKNKSDSIPKFTNSYGNVLDDYDGFTRSTIGANTAIFAGEYDVDAVLDGMK